MPGRYLSVSRSRVSGANETSANDFPIISDGKKTVYLIAVSLIAYTGSISFYQKVSATVTWRLVRFVDLIYITVGLGKTIMIASLLHTNRVLQEPPPSPSHPSLKLNNQLLPDGPKEKGKPRQVRLQTAFKNRSNAKSTVNDTPRPQQDDSNRIPSATLVVAPTSLLNQWGEELKRCSEEGTIDVYIWHGQNRFSLREALYPDEVEYINVDDDDEQDEIESHSDKEDEDVIMVGESDSEVEGHDNEEWRPKAKSKRVTRTKPKKDRRKKIQVVVTSYGVLVSEHAKYEKSVRKSESSVFESASAFSTWICISYCPDQSTGSALFWMKPTIVNPALAGPPKRSVR